MATKVTDTGIIYPDGSEQTTAAFGSGGSVDAYTKAETDEKFYDKDEIDSLIEGASGAIVAQYTNKAASSVARDPLAGNLYLVSGMSITTSYESATVMYISDTDGESTVRDLDQVKKDDKITLTSDNGSGVYTIADISKLSGYRELILSKESATGTIADTTPLTVVLDVAESSGGGTAGSLPQGSIIMWSDPVVPDDWQICDGTNDTPDLRDKFIVGAGTTYALDATGGSKDAVAVSHNHGASTNATGGHTHTININATTSNGSGCYSSNFGGGIPTVASSNAGHHAHTVTVNAAGVSGANKNLPPYYSLYYIMKMVEGGGGSGGGIEEAPEDGKQYARKDGDWSEVEATSGSGGGSSTPAKAPEVTVFKDGTGTYTTPTGALYLTVEMVGGGGGGSAANSVALTAGVGGTTIFGEASCTGGGGGRVNDGSQLGGVADIASYQGVGLDGGRGGCNGANNGTNIAGNGAPSAFGGGGLGGGGTNRVDGAAGSPNTGAGGGGGGGAGVGAGRYAAGGGSAGAYANFNITTPNKTYDYTVGTGGAGAVSDNNFGGAGGSGVIIVTAHFGSTSSSGGEVQEAVAVRAEISSSQAFAAGTWEKVKFDTVSGDKLFDTSSSFDTTLNRFVPTTAGYYQVNSVVRITGDSSSMSLAQIKLRKNDEDYEGGNLSQDSTSAGDQFNLSTIVYLNGLGDYIEIYGYAGGTNLSFQSLKNNVNSCWMSAHLITGQSTGTGGSGSGDSGKVLQVVNNTHNIAVSTASTARLDTGLTATITPSSASSKILVLVSQTIYKNIPSTSGAKVWLMRDSTDLFVKSRVGLTDTGTNGNYVNYGANHLDSPNTTSAVTYKTQFANHNGTGIVYANIDTDTAGITLLEIAG